MAGPAARMKRKVKFIPHKRDRNLENAHIAGHAARLVEKPLTACPNLTLLFEERYATVLMNSWMEGWHDADRKMQPPAAADGGRIMTPDQERRIRRNVESGWEVSGIYIEDVALLLTEIDRLRQWVADLQRGMYINCVYCGYRYGRADQVPASKQAVLKAHIAQCPEHPMSALLEAAKRVVHEDEAGEITGGAIEDCKQAIEKAEAES